MSNARLSLMFASIYLLLVAIIFASELHLRIFDRGNSAMAGLFTYMATTPSSFLIDSIAETVFGIKIGGSDAAFIIIFILSGILNAIFVYFVMLGSLTLMLKTFKIK